MPPHPPTPARLARLRCRLRSRRLARAGRPVGRTLAVAAAEPEVAEAAAAAAEPAALAAEPAPEQQEDGWGKKRRSRGAKKVLGPARTIATSDVEVGKWYDGVVVSAPPSLVCSGVKVALPAAVPTLGGEGRGVDGP